MLISDAQVKRFWREWSAACKMQKWTRAAGLSSAQIDARRKDLLKRAGFDSLTHVDRAAGFGRVLAELGLLKTQLVAAVEHGNPSLDAARRKRWVIRNVTLRRLGVYVSDPQAYLDSIVRDKFDWRRVESGYAVPLTLDDMTDDPVIRERDGKLVEQPSQLDQILFTLDRSIQKNRKEAGHSIHDMQIEAGLECSCAKCCRDRKVPNGRSISTHIPALENQPF